MAEKAMSIQSYKPAKGIKLTITLKDGSEIVGTVTSQNANSIKLDAETVLRRKMRSISFRGRVLAERGTRGGGSKKQKLSARTASGSPRKGEGKGRRGRNKASAAPAEDEGSVEGGALSFSLNGECALVVTRVSDRCMESIALSIEPDTWDKLAAFGVDKAE